MAAIPSSSSKPSKKKKTSKKAGESVRAEDVPISRNASPAIWPYRTLAQSKPSPCKPVYSANGRFCFVPVQAQVQIYAVATAELLSTLLPQDTLTADYAVTAMSFHPTNEQLLIIGTSDGNLRIWDYLEGNVLEKIELGEPVQHLCIHPKHPHSIFVAVSRQVQKWEGEVGFDGNGHGKRKRRGTVLHNFTHTNSIIHEVSLLRKNKKVKPAKRLGKARSASAMIISNDGRFLIITGRHKVHIKDLAKENSPFIKFKSTESITSLAVHPSEPYFATGDEKGQIRLWHVLDDAEWPKYADAPVGEDGESTAPAPQTSILHWHAHAVADLAYTPNGAYLLSGGQEAVLVLWHTQSEHREYIPRLTGPIQAIEVIDDKSRNQEFAVRLADGTISFVSAETLQIVREISGIRTDATGTFETAQKRDIPLAMQPRSNNLVLQSAVPSSIQFYSLNKEKSVLEVEISPGNRVTRTDQKPIEPTRVEKVCFSGVDAAGECWMATLDRWQEGYFGEEVQLKLWKSSNHGKQFTLNTRVDSPHVGGVLSMSFAQNRNFLVTTGNDKQVKVWVERQGSWRCRSSLSHRGYTPYNSAWSQDSSLLAIAHGTCVTLWSADDLQLLQTLTCPHVKQLDKVAFVGKEHDKLVAAGANGTIVWDIATCKEIQVLETRVDNLQTFNASFLTIANNILPAGPSTVGITVSLTTSEPSISARTLPSSVRSINLLPTSSPTLAMVTQSGDIILAGDSIPLKPTAASKITYTGVETLPGLFKDLIVKSNPLEGREKVVAPAVSLGRKKRKDGKTLEALFDGPSQSLPAPSQVFDDFMEFFLDLSLEFKDARKKKRVGVDGDAEVATNGHNEKEGQDDVAVRLNKYFPTCFGVDYTSPL